jgi:hypothetical protein
VLMDRSLANLNLKRNIGSNTDTHLMMMTLSQVAPRAAAAAVRVANPDYWKAWCA